MSLVDLLQTPTSNNTLENSRLAGILSLVDKFPEHLIDSALMHNSSSLEKLLIKLLVISKYLEGSSDVSNEMNDASILDCLLDVNVSRNFETLQQQQSVHKPTPPASVEPTESSSHSSARGAVVSNSSKPAEISTNQPNNNSNLPTNFFDVISNDCFSLILSFVPESDMCTTIWQTRLHLVSKKWREFVYLHLSRPNPNCLYNNFYTLSELYENCYTQIDFDYRLPDGRFTQVNIYKFEWPLKNSLQGSDEYIARTKNYKPIALKKRDPLLKSHLNRDNLDLIRACKSSNPRSSLSSDDELILPPKLYKSPGRISFSSHVHDPCLYFPDQAGSKLNANSVTRFAPKYSLTKRPVLKKSFDITKMYGTGLSFLIEVNLQRLNDFYFYNLNKLQTIFSVADVARVHTKRDWVVAMVELPTSYWDTLSFSCFSCSSDFSHHLACITLDLTDEYNALQSVPMLKLANLNVTDMKSDLDGQTRRTMKIWMHPDAVRLVNSKALEASENNQNNAFINLYNFGAFTSKSQQEEFMKLVKIGPEYGCDYLPLLRFNPDEMNLHSTELNKMKSFMKNIGEFDDNIKHINNNKFCACVDFKLSKKDKYGEIWACGVLLDSVSNELLQDVDILKPWSGKIGIRLYLTHAQSQYLGNVNVIDSAARHLYKKFEASFPLKMQRIEDLVEMEPLFVLDVKCHLDFEEVDYFGKHSGASQQRQMLMMLEPKYRSLNSLSVVKEDLSRFQLPSPNTVGNWIDEWNDDDHIDDGDVDIDKNIDMEALIEEVLDESAV